MSICPYCGEEEAFDLHEIWNSREFMIRTCCEQSEEDARWSVANDPEWARAALRHLGIEEICGEQLRRVADDGMGALILDWQFRLDRITFRDARRFVDRHHEHLDAPTGWRFGQGLWNGPDLLGVVMVGQPLARAFDRPAALRWNACSALYGWAAREARLRGFHRIITYTRQDEGGTTLRAAGWTCDGPAGGRSWNWRGRPRTDRSPPCPRWRWSRHLPQAAPRVPKPRPVSAEPLWIGEWREEEVAI